MNFSMIIKNGYSHNVLYSGHTLPSSLFRMKMQSPAPIILMKAGIGQNVSCPVDYLTYKYLGLCIHGDVASGIYVTHLVRPGIC